MRLSIIIAMYNAQKYIEKCLESAVNHDIDSDDYEVIIINDGSMDLSLSIVKDFLSRNPTINIEIISKENGGQGSARNLGLNLAKGKYILFLDSDDWIDSNNLVPLLVNAEKNNLDILSFNFNRINEDGKLLKPQKFYKKPNKIMSGPLFMYENTLSGAMCLYLYSSKLISEHKIRFIESIFHEDEEFIVQAFSFASRVSHSDLILYNYLIRSNSTVRNIDVQHRTKLLKDILLIINVLCKKKDLSKDRFLIKGLTKKNNQLAISLLLRIFKENYPREVVSEVIDKLKIVDLYPVKLYGLSFRAKIFAMMMNNRFIKRILLKNKI